MPRKRAVSPERMFYEARPDLGGAVVKSAQRVIEVFELFSDLKARVTIVDVALRLKLPQSSTSALLRSLHTLGYLSFDPVDRTYFPTSRVALLGHWIEPQLLSEGPVLKMARDVTQETGLDVFLAIRNKLNIQVIYRNYGPKPKVHSPTGAGSYLALAATGHVLMIDLDEREVTKIVTATNDQIGGEAATTPRVLIEKLARVRVDGFSIGPSRRSTDRTTIAIRLPATMTEPMAFGLNMPTSEVGDDPHRWVDILRGAVRRWLMPEHAVSGRGSGCVISPEDQ